MIRSFLRLHARFMAAWYDAEYSAIMPGSPYATRALEKRAYWRAKLSNLNLPR